MEKSKEEWKEKLTKEQYEVLFEHKTEPRFSGEHLENKAEGTYTCAACGTPLFSSETKFDSKTGWPSFYDVMDNENVGEQEDNGFLMRRTEVHCNKCKGHLGHVFNDGPDPTGKRYCINSVSLGFDPKK